MKHAIETIQTKKLVGKRVIMTLSDDKTIELWRSFMPRRKEIANTLTNELYSLRIYNSSFNFFNIDPHAPFEKWAAVEVADFDTVPPEMNTYSLSGGLYAVFHYKGSSSEGEKAFRYIFEEWLPNSPYLVDNTRPHFEVLGEKYKNNNSDSEELIYLPIKGKE